MDFFAVNGNALNGSSTPLVAASANIVGSVDVGATATRIVLPSATLDAGSAQVVANQTLTQAAGADVSCATSLQVTPTLTQAASAAVAGSVDMLVIVQRTVAASALIDCYAGFSVIPASILGSANITGSAALAANATKIQPGAAAMPGTVAVATAPVVTRYVSAAIAGSAALRVEAKLNNKLDAYADLVLSASVTSPDIGIVQRQAGAYVELIGDFAPNATYIYASPSADLSCSIDIEPDSVVVSIPFVQAVADPLVITAAATRNVFSSASMTASADVGAPALQKFAGAVSAQGSVDVAAAATILRSALIDLGGGSGMSADATAVRMAGADVSASVDIAATMKNTAAARANIVDPGTQLVAAPTRICLAAVNGVVTAEFLAQMTMTCYAGADAGGPVDVIADAVAITSSAANFSLSASFDAYAGLLLGAVSILGLSIDIGADARLNIEAFDPAEDTMYRPAEDTEFVRPYEETEMRRYA